MDCTKARFLVYAYLDRDLPRFDAEALQRHLADCPPCAARGRSARGVIKLLRTRLDYARAPIGLRERLHGGLLTPQLKPRYAPLGLAASILLLLLPLVADQAGPRTAAMSLAGPVAITAPRSVVPVSRQMTGTFVCLQCEGRHGRAACPLDERIHELGFCADNGETWRMMTADAALTAASVGQTVTVEGVTFPQSGFLRASRVGY
ncbi:MAG: zf-HC2 domain-containing protein [Acidobacteriota bacterium]